MFDTSRKTRKHFTLIRSQSHREEYYLRFRCGHVKFERRTFFLLFMFPVIVIVLSSNTIKLFLYALFMPAKTTPPYSKTPQQQHLHQWLQTMNVYGSICFIELNVPNFPSIFRAFVRLWTYFGLPEVVTGGLCDIVWRLTVIQYRGLVPA